MILSEKNFGSPGELILSNVITIPLTSSSEWEDFVGSNSKGWRDFYSNWLRVNYSVHLVQYEITKEKPEEQVRGIGRFLGVSQEALNNHTHIDCVVDKKGWERLIRKRLDFKTSPFTEKMNKTINGYIEEIEQLAKSRLGVDLRYS